jgi:hypothetical protein
MRTDLLCAVMRRRNQELMNLPVEGSPARRHTGSACHVAIVKGQAAMRVQVESVADDRGVELPGRLHLGGRKVEIVERDDQWHGADYRYFKVKGDDGNVYILRFDESRSEWALTMFQSPKAPIPKGQASRAIDCSRS